MLEIARFHVETSGDAAAAQAAVTTLLEKYRTSESVPMAYVLAGRIVLMKGRSTEDINRALSQFERVEVFGASDAQSAALHFATEALSSDKRHADALARHRQLAALSAVALDRAEPRRRPQPGAARSAAAGHGNPAADPLGRSVLTRRGGGARLEHHAVSPVHQAAASQPAYAFMPPVLGGTAGKLRDVLGVLALPSGDVVAVHRAGAFVLNGTGRTSSSMTGADVRRALLDTSGRVTLVQRTGLNRQGAGALALSSQAGQVHEASGTS